MHLGRSQVTPRIQSDLGYDALIHKSEQDGAMTC